MSKLVNSTPGALYRIPTTIFKLKKSVASSVAIQKYIRCSICQCYSPTISSKVVCEACSTPLKMYNSSNDSLWPIQVYQNFLHPKIRYIPENIIVVGLHRGKPEMSDFFHPFLNELQTIKDEGGIKFEKNGQNLLVLPVITSCSADLPAKAQVQGMVGHSGYFGCGYCLIKGDPIKKDSKSKAVIRFLAKESSIRTHQKVMETYATFKSLMNSKPVNGIKNISCMVAAEDFDLVNGFSIDYMHCVLLGIMRKLTDLWLNTANKSQSFFISKKKQIELNKRILQIKPTLEITRKPRSLDHRKEFKANEFRSLLLYYLRYCLEDLLPVRFINHFQLLSSAIYILLKEKVSHDDIVIAEAKLIQFADQFEKFYFSHNVTMNLHLVRHIANSVRYLGPLWAQSTFGFETNNGLLVKSSHAKADFLQSVASKYVMKFSLQEKRDELAEIIVGGRKNVRIEKAENQQLKEMGVNVDVCSIYSFIVLKNMKITSLQSKEISTVDFFVEFRSKEIGAIKYYIAENKITYAFAEMYIIIGSNDHFTEIQRTNINKLFNVKEISKKMLFLKVGKKEIVTSIPNKYEKT